MDALDVPTALIAIFEVVQRANKYIDETAPWVLAKSEETKPRLEAVLYNLCDALRTVTVLMQAYLPNTAPKMAGFERPELCRPGKPSGRIPCAQGRSPIPAH